MRGPSIQKTAAVSLLLHLALLAFSVVIINYSKDIVLPSPYTVSLVNPEETGRSGPPSSGARAPEAQTNEPQAAKKEAAEKQAPVKKDKMIDAVSKNEQKTLEESMAALLAKKKVERIAKLRQVLSVKSSGQQSNAATSQKGGPPGGTKGSMFDSYYGKITDEIREEWAYPDYMKKNLEAIVSVVIGKDGVIKVQGVEKSSGDRFFDRSALEAVRKASPVSPPPYEMEIGIRFYP